MKQKNTAFTLVELIVVITILAILGTIAFISMQGYSKTSRDSVRISDVSTMKTSLELFHLNAGKYPLPDGSGMATYSGSTLWYQGDFGDVVTSNLSRNISEVPTDPLSDKKYIYSVMNTKNEFQLLSLLEGDLALNNINQTNAATLDVTPKVDGNYNGVYVRTTTHIVPVPSIITAEDITGGLTLDGTNIKSQVINNGENVPDVGGNVLPSTGELTNLKLSVWTGSLTSKSSDADKVEVMEAIQGAYTGSSLVNDGIYYYILSQTGTGELTALVDSVVLGDSSSIPTDSSGGGEEETPEVICNYGEVVSGGICTDPYWANVTLLAHFEGTDGVRTYTDETSQAYTWVEGSYTSPHISNEITKFGSTSLKSYAGRGDTYVYVPPKLPATGEFTAEGWFYRTYDGSNNQYFFSQYAFKGSTRTSFGMTSNDLPLAGFGNSGNVTSATTVPLNEWFHLAFTRDNSDTVRIFIDGNEVASQINSGGIEQSNFWIGQLNQTTTTNSWVGYIDDLRITSGIARYTSSFSAPIQALSHIATPVSGVCGSDNGLDIAITPTNTCSVGTVSNMSDNGLGSTYTWNCDGPSGGPAVNCSANHTCNYGEVIDGGICTDPYWANVTLLAHFEGTDGVRTYTDETSQAYTWVEGSYTSPHISNEITKFGSTSLKSYAGRGDTYVYVPPKLPATGEFTAEGWFYRTYDGSNNQYFFSQYAFKGSTRTSFGMTSNDLPLAGFGNSGNVTSATTVPLNEWFHLAFTRDNSDTVRIFIDGNEVASQINSGGIEQSNFWIGQLNQTTTTNSWVGYIDELRVTSGVARYTSNFQVHTKEFPTQ